MTYTVRERIRRVQEDAAAQLRWSVRPLAVPDSTGLELIPAGSAVLIWHRGTRYILSAAHVVELYPECAYYLGTRSTWIELPRPFRVPPVPPGGRDNDPYDFAFHAVAPELATQLDGCEFLTADRVATNDQLVFETPARSKYIALGFPLNKFKLKRGSKTTITPSLAYAGGIVPRHKYDAVKIDPRQHIVIEFDQKQVIGSEGQQHSPAIKGLSGGGMFRIPALERVSSNENPRLAAITIEHRAERRLIVGVRIELVLSAISKDVRENPELYPQSV